MVQDVVNHFNEHNAATSVTIVRASAAMCTADAIFSASSPATLARTGKRYRPHASAEVIIPSLIRNGDAFQTVLLAPRTKTLAAEVATSSALVGPALLAGPLKSTGFRTRVPRFEPPDRISFRIGRTSRRIKISQKRSFAFFISRRLATSGPVPSLTYRHSLARNEKEQLHC